MMHQYDFFETVLEFLIKTTVGHTVGH